MNISKSLSLFTKNAAQVGLKSALIVGLAFLLPGCGSSSDGGGLQGTNTLERSFEGTVLDEAGTPLSGVRVTVEESGDSAESNANGYYAIQSELDPSADVTLLVETDSLLKRIEIAPQGVAALEVNIQFNPGGNISVTIAPLPEKRDSVDSSENLGVITPEVPTEVSKPKKRVRCIVNPENGNLRCRGGAANNSEGAGGVVEAPDPAYTNPVGDGGIDTPTEYTGTIEQAPGDKNASSPEAPSDENSEPVANESAEGSSNQDSGTTVTNLGAPSTTSSTNKGGGMAAIG